MSYGLPTVLASLLIGVMMGALAAMALLRPRLALARDRATRREAEFIEAKAAEQQLAVLRAHLSGLRHDLRGILSPALLVSDRLLTHEEPHVRRAGEVMIRTVDRAVARLAETRLDQDPAITAQL